MKLSGIVHYMMPYCTFYFKFLSAWFWGVPQQNKDFAFTTYGGGASLIRYSSKTDEQNFMKLSGIVNYMMPYCTSYSKVLYAWFWGVPNQNKDFAIIIYGGAEGIILWALLTVFLVIDYGCKMNTLCLCCYVQVQHAEEETVSFQCNANYNLCFLLL